MSLHERITKARKDKGITQEELAEMSNVTVRTIQRIESGESIPRSYTLKALVKALDQSYEWLTADETIIQAGGHQTMPPTFSKCLTSRALLTLFCHGSTS